jgi:hypothetical protein
VTESIVLNDHTGLHLGAGPLLLFYDRASDLGHQEDNQLTCPRIVKVIERSPSHAVTYLTDYMQDLVQQDNMTFLSELPPEIASLYSGLVKLNDEQPLEEECTVPAEDSIQGEPASEPMVQANSVGET